MDLLFSTALRRTVDEWARMHVRPDSNDDEEDTYIDPLMVTYKSDPSESDPWIGFQLERAARAAS